MKSTVLLFFFLLSTNTFANNDTMHMLINELSYSQDLEVKQSIIKSLRNYTTSPVTREKLSSIISDQTQFDVIRIEALKAISGVANDQKIKNIIINAHDLSTSINFRAASLQALYAAAPTSIRIKRVLMQNLHQNHDVRIHVASAFALMASTNDTQIFDTLVRVVKNNGHAPIVRIEAIKSLYSQRNKKAFRGLLNSVALNGFDNQEVRVAAIKLLSIDVKRSSTGQSFLINLYNNSYNTNVRSAVARGLKLKLSENDIRWFRLTTDPRTKKKRSPFYN